MHNNIYCIIFYISEMKIKAVGTILYLIATIIFCNNCLAQDYPTPDSAINKFIVELQRKGIDTICVYQYYFPGAVMLFKPETDTTCIHSDRANVYFIWKNKGASYITLRNECSDYNPIIVNADKLWRFYTANRSKINTEKIKPSNTLKPQMGRRNFFQCW